MKKNIHGLTFTAVCFVLLLTICGLSASKIISYPIVDTNQSKCFDNSDVINCPAKGESFYGQDAQYKGNQPQYKDNNNGTVTDLVTGLMWTKDPGEKMTYDEAIKKEKNLNTGGYIDWRVPDIKELYSLIQFSGVDIDPRGRSVPASVKPFIDSDYFVFKYGNPDEGERLIDSQFLSRTLYVSYTMNRDRTLFGVNFADGRIKGYPIEEPRTKSGKKFHVLYVRGPESYGVNKFRDNGDGTITDEATGLMWMKNDSGHLKAGKKSNGTMNWSEALAWAESLTYGGYSDWRLPNAKELQSIVDYTRSPATSNSAAIDPVFNVTKITDEGGGTDYPFYWTGTTHESVRNGQSAVYVSFGRSYGFVKPPFGGDYKLLDVHGAGSQRSDPKAGNPDKYPHGHGPQGDVIRIYNMVRCVRTLK